MSAVAVEAWDVFSPETVHPNDSPLVIQDWTSTTAGFGVGEVLERPVVVIEQSTAVDREMEAQASRVPDDEDSRRIPAQHPFHLTLTALTGK